MNNLANLIKDKTDIDDIYKKIKGLPKETYEQKVSTLLYLLKLPIAGIRNTALYIASNILKDETIIDMLRNDADDVMRNSAMEIIKNKGEAGLNLALRLIKDDDNDVVLSAVLILDHFKDKRTIRPLVKLLEKNKDINIIQAVLLALGNTGDKSVLEILLKYLDKEIWLQIASITALGELRSPITLKYLRKFVSNEMLSSFALESISKIGNKTAFNIIFDYLIKNRDSMDLEHILGHLCNIAESRKIELKKKYLIELRKYIDNDEFNANIKNLSVRIILSAGIREDIPKLLEILLMTTSSDVFPMCLKNRYDLISELISINNINATKWAIIIAKNYIKKIDTFLVTQIINSVKCLFENNYYDENLINLLIELLKKYKNQEIAEDVFDLYLKIPFIERMFLNQVLQKYKSILPEIIKKKQPLDRKTQVVLDILTGNITDSTLEDFFTLRLHRIKMILPFLLINKSFIEKIPFDYLMKKVPEDILPFISILPNKSKAKRYLPFLREILNATENPEVIKIIGELKDKNSVERLISLTDSKDDLIRTLAIESLGKIGNESARKKLKDISINSNKNKISRVAFMALTSCIQKEDINFFRKALFDNDWYIRYLAIDALIKLKDSKLDKYLFKLLSDPVKAISDKVKSVLENKGIKSEH